VNSIKRASKEALDMLGLSTQQSIGAQLFLTEISATLKSAVSAMSLAFALQALPPGEMKNQIALRMVANNEHASVPLPTHLDQNNRMAPVMPHSKVASPVLVAHSSCQPSQTMESQVQPNSLPITCIIHQSSATMSHNVCHMCRIVSRKAYTCGECSVQHICHLCMYEHCDGIESGEGGVTLCNMYF